MTTIPFTDEHVHKIRNGDKISTMRTVKSDNVYAEGKKYRVDGTDDLYIKICNRVVIEFGPEKAEAVDANKEIFVNQPAKHDALRTVEGFDSIGDMMDWFRSRNYNLPQPFFLYFFEPIERRTEEGDA